MSAYEMVAASHYQKAKHSVWHSLLGIKLLDLPHFKKVNASFYNRTVRTRAGIIMLRRNCSPSFVQKLYADDGLWAFAHNSEREYQLLLEAAQRPDNTLTLAYTPTGVIVGAAILALADEWWKGIESLYEVALEVSSNWRGMGIGSHLLAATLADEKVEEKIILAMGLSWHWDISGLGLSVSHYRKMIAKLFTAQGFVAYTTREPNISMRAANILLARIGNEVNPDIVNQFRSRLLSSPMPSKSVMKT